MKDDKMSAVTQKNLDRAQRALERLIDLTEDARVDACNEGFTDQRDLLDEIGAHLRMARAKAGKLAFPGGITTRSGGEK